MKKPENRGFRPGGFRRETPAGTQSTASTAPGGSGGSRGASVPERPTGREVERSEHLSLGEIKELIELVAEKQFNEFELERGGFRLRLQRGGQRATVEVQAATGVQPVSVVVPAPVSAPELPVSSNVQPTADEKLHVITSPIVGTFYRSSSPTAEPFVRIGDMVEVGRTVCIIEAMKLMNEISAEVTGTIAKIFIENGQPVEYGQPLFGLKQ